jgi:hypothetical protein
MLQKLWGFNKIYKFKIPYYYLKTLCPEKGDNLHKSASKQAITQASYSTISGSTPTVATHTEVEIEPNKK